MIDNGTANEDRCIAHGAQHIGYHDRMASCVDASEPMGTCEDTSVPHPRDRRDWTHHPTSGSCRSWTPIAPVPDEPTTDQLEWREGSVAYVGPAKGEVIHWHAVSEVTDGRVSWEVTAAAPNRFTLRASDANVKSSALWLGHRPTLASAKALAESLARVLATPPEHTEGKGIHKEEA